MNEVILTNKKLLVVEDNAINQLLIQRTLEKYGPDLTLAVNGKNTIEQLLFKTFDLILLDLHLPDMNGYEVINIIRKNLRIETPVYALTAMDLESERDKCIAAGMNGCISKPFNIKKLEDAIHYNYSGMEAAAKPSEFIIGDDETTVDLEFLYTVAANDKEYIRLMIHTFIDSFPPLIDKMHHYYETGNWEELQKTAHYCKSSLSVIKVKQMVLLAASIEWQCKIKTGLEGLNDKINQLSATFENSRNILLKLLQQFE